MVIETMKFKKQIVSGRSPVAFVDTGVPSEYRRQKKRA
jgi:hypothetical protein